MMNEVIIKLEKIMNECLRQMQNDITSYKLDVDKQKELISKYIDQVGEVELQKPLAVELIANYIYSKTNYSSVNLYELMDYVENNYRKGLEWNKLIKTLNKLVIEKKTYYLDRSLLDTYENKGYMVSLKAIEELKDNGTYKLFSKRNYGVNSVEDKVNNRQELAQNCNKQDIDKIIVHKLKHRITNDSYEEYINMLTVDRQTSYLLNTIQATLLSKSKDEVCDALKKFIIDRENYMYFTKYVDNNKKINYRGQLYKYVNPIMVTYIIKNYLISDGVDISRVTNDELISMYVDNQANKLNEDHKQL